MLVLLSKMIIKGEGLNIRGRETGAAGGEKERKLTEKCLRGRRNENK